MGRKHGVSAIQAPLADGTPASAAEVIDRYWERAYRFAAMITRNDQESADIAHDALIKVLRHLDRFDPQHGSFDSWLWRIVFNAARDAGRATRRRDALPDRLGDRHDSAGDDVETLALQRLDDAELLAAVRRLPQRPRTLIALRFGAGLTYREVGEQIGLSEAAALMAVRRALSILRRDLGRKESMA